MGGGAADFEQPTVLEALGELSGDSFADLVVEDERVDLGVEVYNAGLDLLDFGVHLVIDCVLEFLVHTEYVVLLLLQDLVHGQPFRLQTLYPFLNFPVFAFLLELLVNAG